MAKKGNNYAEKWDGDTVLNILLQMLDQVKKDKDIRYISELLILFDLYDDIWAYWKKKFNPNSKDGRRKEKYADDVFRLSNTIETNLHARLLKKNEQVRNNSINLVLKNKYGYVEKIETNNTNDNSNTGAIDIRVSYGGED